MITNLEHVTQTTRPFWRFSVLVDFLGQATCIHGFIYREGEEVQPPWIKFGRQGSKGKRTELMSLSGHQLRSVSQAVAAAIRPAGEQDWDRAHLLFQSDSEACRKLYPKVYRDLFALHTSAPELFQGLPEGRMWPDEGLERWVALTLQGQRPKNHIVEDVQNGVISEADHARLVEMLS